MNISPGVQALADIIERHEREGWKPYLLTFHFDVLYGSKTAVRDQMNQEVEAAYGRFVTRVVRKPTALSQMGRLPVWITCPDLPVYKREKQSIRVVAKNNGEHVQGVCALPPWSRHAFEFDRHLEVFQGLYVRPENKLALLHAKPMTHDTAGVLDYVTKCIKRGLVSEDHLLLLPRTRDEVLQIGKTVGRQSTIFG